MVKIHDLVWFQSIKDLEYDGELPDWVNASINQAPIGVVRRGVHVPDEVLIGIRGHQKSQRFAAKLSQSAIVKVIDSRKLIKVSIAEVNDPTLPVWQGLPEINQYLVDHQLNWGISGSAAYELATGISMVNANSDVDLIAVDQSRISLDDARAILEFLNQFGFHADVQIMHEQKGFSLEEWVNNSTQSILIKTAQGPILSTDPWNEIYR